jgi:hypothetical protein
MLLVLTIINTLILALLSAERIKSLLDKTDIDEKVIAKVKSLLEAVKK